MVIEPTAGGWGAFQGNDGQSALINLSNGAFRNIPAEVYERKHPIQIEEFSIRQDSGGVGRWRGGCGVIRSYRTLAECDTSLWFERSKTPAWGIFGGGSGAPPKIEIKGPGVSLNLLKLRARTIPPGTVVRTMTGGGGGYGSAAERPAAEVLDDVIEGYVSIEAAARDYCVAIDPITLTIDETRTNQLRR
jgi:N-methylhydantoinase B